MYKNILYIVLPLLLLFSCQKEGERQSVPSGELQIAMEQPEGSFTVTTKAGDVSTDDYIVNIVRFIDGQSVYSGRWGDMSKSMELKSGMYDITVESTQLEDASYDNPYYYSCDRFTINVEETTELSVTCSLSNVMVTTNYSDEFASKYNDFTITISNGKGELTFGPNVTDKSGYFAATGALIVTFKGDSKELGAQVTHSYTISAVKARDHHILNFGAAPAASSARVSQQLLNEGVVVGDIEFDI